MITVQAIVNIDSFSVSFSAYRIYYLKAFLPIEHIIYKL